jgi:hypothetical protein
MISWNDLWETHVKAHEWRCNDLAISRLEEAVNRLTLGNDECADEEYPYYATSLPIFGADGRLLGRCCCLGGHPTAGRMSCK